MSVLEGYEPKEVLKYFEEICGIYHASGEEKEISDYLVKFATDRNLSYYQDDMLNVIIYKDATSDMADKDTIILQSHIDMVAVADEGCDFTGGIKLRVEDGLIKSTGTTLGADNGIGVAYILAILDSNEISHPKLECVFTTSEEIGLLGAAGLDLTKISGKKLINLDSEDERNVTIGCAGGSRADMEFTYKGIKEKGILIDVIIDGLVGGHSGMEIHKQRANANVLMGRTLYELSKSVKYGLISIEGGIKDNAITTRTVAKIIVKKKNMDALESFIEKINEIYIKEYYFTDKDLSVKLVPQEKVKEKVIEEFDFKRLMVMMNNTSYGPIKMRQDSLGQVETSMNLGIVRVGDGKVSIGYSLRSNIQSGRDWQKSRLVLLADMLDAKLEFTGEYPAWEAVGVSDLAKKAVEVYKNLYDEELNVVTDHAGLECALFCSKDKNMSAISIGPDLSDVHTTSETASIESIKKEWKFIIELLKG